MTKLLPKRGRQRAQAYAIHAAHFTDVALDQPVLEHLRDRTLEDVIAL